MWNIKQKASNEQTKETNKPKKNKLIATDCTVVVTRSGGGGRRMKTVERVRYMATGDQTGW